MESSPLQAFPASFFPFLAPAPRALGAAVTTCRAPRSTASIGPTFFAASASLAVALTVAASFRDAASAAWVSRAARCLLWDPTRSRLWEITLRCCGVAWRGRCPTWGVVHTAWTKRRRSAPVISSHGFFAIADARLPIDFCSAGLSFRNALKDSRAFAALAGSAASDAALRSAACWSFARFVDASACCAVLPSLFLSLVSLF